VPCRACPPLCFNALVTTQAEQKLSVVPASTSSPHTAPRHPSCATHTTVCAATCTPLQTGSDDMDPKLSCDVASWLRSLLRAGRGFVGTASSREWPGLSMKASPERTERAGAEGRDGGCHGRRNTDVDVGRCGINNRHSVRSTARTVDARRTVPLIEVVTFVYIR